MFSLQSRPIGNQNIWLLVTWKIQRQIAGIVEQPQELVTPKLQQLSIYVTDIYQ